MLWGHIFVHLGTQWIQNIQFLGQSYSMRSSKGCTLCEFRKGRFIKQRGIAHVSNDIMTLF